MDSTLSSYQVEIYNERISTDLNLVTWQSTVHGPPENGLKNGTKHVGALLHLFQLTHIYFHLVVCLTTGPKPLPNWALHIVRSRASSFKWEYPLLSLRSSSSFLHLLPCLPVTSIPLFIFPSITHCRRQFLRKMWPIQFAFRLRISCRIFLCSLTLILLHFSHAHAWAPWRWS